MPFTKKIGRAVQWAGEKMGSEAKTAHSEEFQRLEAEMALRQEGNEGLLCEDQVNANTITGMEHLQKSASVYMKWISKRCDASEDKGRAPPTAFLGRSMTAHGNDFESDSEFGTALVSLGRAHERIANLHSNYSDDVNANWMHHVDRSVAVMKDYQVRRSWSCIAVAMTNSR